MARAVIESGSPKLVVTTPTVPKIESKTLRLVKREGEVSVEKYVS